MTTPNKSFYSDKLVWATELPPVHQWWFTEESIKILAEKLGMSMNLFDFTRFYKRRYHAVDMKELENSTSPSPVLDENWKPLPEKSKRRELALYAVRKFVSGIPMAAAAVRILKGTFNKNLRFCGQRGSVLAAILTRK